MNESTRRQLQIAVERVVRPVRVGWERQVRIREELMAHVTGIFEEEWSRLGDEAAAAQGAVRRFGDPAKLTDELNASRSSEQRFAYLMERWFGWRAPESAARYTFRLSMRVFLTIFFLLVVVPITLSKIMGGPNNRAMAFDGRWVIPCLVCAALFPLGLLYFKIRDAMFGFCSPRSWPRVAGYGVLFALVFFAFGLASATLGAQNWQEGWDLIVPNWLIVSMLAPIMPIVLARFRGPAEIRHTEWSSLQLDSTPKICKTV